MPLLGCIEKDTNVTQTQTAKCVRCRQPLPEGSGFCVTCGHLNENALIERQVKVMRQANDRIGFAQKFRDICRGIGGWFRWS
jgi:hypothetical protein